MANFPEKRALIKFTRLVAENSALGIKYQYSDLKQDARQHFLEAKITQTITDETIALASVQFLRDSRGYSAFQGGVGTLWDINALTSIQGDVQYFYRGPEAAIVGGRMGTVNARMKFRQVLTLSTALQFEYSFYDAKGEGLKFSSHTAALWLSQFLPTQTAVHLNMRVLYEYNGNYIGGSFSRSRPVHRLGDDALAQVPVLQEQKRQCESWRAIDYRAGWIAIIVREHPA